MGHKSQMRAARMAAIRINRNLSRTTGGTMDRRFEDRVVAITAAASGIGRASALRFASEGARLVLNDIDTATLHALAAHIRDQGGEVSVLCGDVSLPQTLDALVGLALERHGQLDVLHNNAGVGVHGLLHEMRDEDWRRQFAVIVDAAFFGTRAALRIMREQQRGVIVNTASGAALAAEYGLGGYAAAKSALVGLTRATAVENAALGIRANAVCPGTVLTPAVEAAMAGADLLAYAAAHPQGRLGHPEEIAAVVAFVASDDASHLNGAVIPIDGGISAQRAAPRSFDVVQSSGAG